VDGRAQRRRQLDDAAPGRRGQPVPQGRKRRFEAVRPRSGRKIQVRRPLSEGVPGAHRRDSRGQFCRGLLANRLHIVTEGICGRRSSNHVRQKRQSEYALAKLFIFVIIAKVRGTRIYK